MDSSRQPRRPFTCRGLVHLSAILPALLFPATTSTPADASPISYALTATAAFPGLGTAELNGSFTFDPMTEILRSASIIVTNLPPYSGRYVEDPAAQQPPEPDRIVIANPVLIGDPGIKILIELVFADPLGHTTDPLLSALLIAPPTQISSAAVMGAAVPVPEPISILILGAFLAAFRLIRQQGLPLLSLCNPKRTKAF